MKPWGALTPSATASRTFPSETTWCWFSCQAAVTCRACKAGRPALCHRAAEVNGSGDLLHGEALLRTPSGERINHHLGVSAFADYAVVARESVVVIDDDVPDTVAAMFGCAVLTGMGAVLNTAAVDAGQSVAVFGLGAVGLSAVMAAALAGRLGRDRHRPQYRASTSSPWTAAQPPSARPRRQPG